MMNAVALWSLLPNGITAFASHTRYLAVLRTKAKIASMAGHT